MKLAIADIVIPKDRQRALNKENVAQKVGSMRAVGLIEPIKVDRNNRLVCGLHRLTAAKELGWEKIEATLFDPEIPDGVYGLTPFEIEDILRVITEADENLCQAELTALERAEILAARKVAYERLYPETKAEEQRKKGLNVSSDKLAALKAAPSFSADTAEKTGLSERTIQRDVAMVRDLAPDVRDAIRDTPLANNKSALAALASEPAELQRELVAAGSDVVREHAKAKRQSLPPVPAPIQQSVDTDSRIANTSQLAPQERARLEAMARGESVEEEAEEEPDEPAEFNADVAALNLYRVISAAVKAWPSSESLKPLISTVRQVLGNLERAEKERSNG